MDAILTYNFKGKLLKANTEARKLLGIGRGSIAAVSLYDHVKLEDLPRLISRNLKLVEGYKTQLPIEYSVRALEGKSIRVQAHGKIVSREGKIYAIEDSIRELAKKNTVLRAFSHSIKTGEIDRVFLRKLQQCLLPGEFPVFENAVMRLLFVPASAPGADFFHLETRDDGSFMIVYGEVSKPAHLKELLAQILQFKLSNKPHSLTTPSQTTAWINSLASNGFTGSQVHFCCALVDPGKRKIIYVNQGLPAPIVLKTHAQPANPVRFQKIPFPGPEKNPAATESEIELESDARIAFFTTGVLSALGGAGDIQKGLGHLKRILQRTRGLKTQEAAFQRIAAALAYKKKKSARSRDLTLFMLDFIERFDQSYSIPSEFLVVDEFVSLINERIPGFDFSDEDSAAIRLCFQELLLNAVEHGNKGDPKKKVSGKISISTKEFMAVIKDQGRGFHPDVIPDPTADEHIDAVLNGRIPPRGWGIFLARSHCDSLEFNETGNQVRFLKAKKPVFPLYDFSDVSKRACAGKKPGCIRTIETDNPQFLKIAVSGFLNLDKTFELHKILENLKALKRVDVFFEDSASVVTRTWAIILRAHLDLQKRKGGIALHIPEAHPLREYLRAMRFDSLMEIDASTL